MVDANDSPANMWGSTRLLAWLKGPTSLGGANTGQTRPSRLGLKGPPPWAPPHP